MFSLKRKVKRNETDILLQSIWSKYFEGKPFDSGRLEKDMKIQSLSMSFSNSFVLKLDSNTSLSMFRIHDRVIGYFKMLIDNETVMVKWDMDNLPLPTDLELVDKFFMYVEDLKAFYNEENRQKILKEIE